MSTIPPSTPPTGKPGKRRSFQLAEVNAAPKAARREKTPTSSTTPRLYTLEECRKLHLDVRSKAIVVECYLHVRKGAATLTSDTEVCKTVGEICRVSDKTVRNVLAEFRRNDERVSDGKSHANATPRTASLVKEFDEDNFLISDIRFFIHQTFFVPNRPFSISALQRELVNSPRFNFEHSRSFLYRILKKDLHFK